MSESFFRSWRTLSSTQIRTWISIIIVFSLVLITSTRLEILRGDAVIPPELTGAGNTLRQGLYLFGVGLMIITLRPIAQPNRILSIPINIVIVILYCFISIAWSDVPEVAFRRALLATMVIWLISRSVDELGHERALGVTLYACVFLVLASYLAIMLSPAAIHHAQETGDPAIVGNWRGLIPHKNATGPLCAFTLLMLVFGCGSFGIISRITLIILSTIFLWMTHSKTSMSLVGIAVICGFAFRAYDARFRLLLIPALIISASALTLALFVYLPGYIAELGSSQDAFTGRIQIWRIMLAYIQDHPLTGTGFGSFWNAGPLSPVNIYSHIGWITTTVAVGHNGYLDIAAQLGIPGLILSVFMILIVPICWIFWTPNLPKTAAGLHLSILLFALGHNFTESTLLAGDEFGEFMIVLSVASLVNMRRLARLSQGGSQKQILARRAHERRMGKRRQSGTLA